MMDRIIENFDEFKNKSNVEKQKEPNKPDLLIESFGDFLNEAKIKEDSDDGLSRAGHAALGMKQVRIVISGDSVPDNSNKILKAVTKNDPAARVEFYEKTGKVVGVFVKAKMDGLKRDIKSIDPKIEIEIKKQTLK